MYSALIPSSGINAEYMGTIKKKHPRIRTNQKSQTICDQIHKNLTFEKRTKQYFIPSNIQYCHHSSVSSLQTTLPLLSLTRFKSSRKYPHFNKMGSASSCKHAVQIPQYIKETHPPFHDLTPTSKPLKAEDDEKIWDDKRVIAPGLAHHIEMLVVHKNDQYITGLEIKYLVDGRTCWARHNGDNSKSARHEIPFKPTEHITHVSCAVFEFAVNTIYLKTNEKKIILIDCDKEGKNTELSKRVDLDLIDSERGVVCFRGRIDKHLESIGVYTMRLVNASRVSPTAKFDDVKEEELDQIKITNRRWLLQKFALAPFLS
eukprot:TRINITY_DN9715_c0_g1_i2.p1 TRINITY_DN9715_c0_g1~~TRINITY_DN9715_c0_g1_i2.p1  ORF type:complete len:316 (+),score=11.28 TRINITY_DN9715_c0_g1_i2:1090-2037(+)